MTSEETRVIRLIVNKLRAAPTPDQVTLLADLLASVAGVDETPTRRRARASETLGPVATEGSA